VPDPLERLTNLVALLLEARQPVTLDEIADALAGQYPAGATARRAAFERDKAALRDGGVPIETEILTGHRAGSTGYRIDRRRYELHLDLTPEETRALQMAVAAVHLRPDWSADALLKLGVDDDEVEVSDREPAARGHDRATGPGPHSASAPARDSASSADAASPSAVLTSLPSLPVLFEASTTHSTVRFRYHDRAREVDPYGLLTRDGFWYLAGHDHGSGERRTFRVDRIESEVVAGSPGAFTVPGDFDLARAVADDPKAIGASPSDQALVEVRPARADKVARELGDAAVVERRADDTIVVRVPCGNLAAFRSWVLGLLDDAVVLGPPDVRHDMVQWLRAISAASP
jgi:proteasome accessory factor B